jgi:site-specific DNA recombinase
MRAIGYVRVSTTDQAQEGVSLDQQAARITAACVARGWTLVELVRDEGYSAKDTKRPGLQAILAEALRPKKRRFDTVLVVKLDRLTRSVVDLNLMLRDFQRWNLGLTSIEETVDTTSATGKLFVNLVACVSQWERETTGERTKSGMTQLRAQGRRAGAIPYGSRLGREETIETRHGPRLIRYLAPCPQEQATLTLLGHLAPGRTLRALGAALHAAGHGPRSGGRWAPQVLSRLVRRSLATDLTPHEGSRA